jgi:hypothetical protein
MKTTWGLVILTILAAPAHAVADECDAKAAEIVAIVGGSVSSRFDASNSVDIKFSHPAFYAASLYCDRSQPIGFIVLTKATYPAPPFYDTFAKSAALIIAKTNADAVHAAAVSCITTALREKGHARGPVSNWVLQCSSNSKDCTNLLLLPAAKT